MSTYIDDKKGKELELKANDIRISLIEELAEAKSGHTAGPLGMADIFTAFYFHILNHNPKDPMWEDRDRLILSNGHITPVRYSAMAHAGYFPLKELMTLRKFGTRLQGHPDAPAVVSLHRPPGLCWPDPDPAWLHGRLLHPWRASGARGAGHPAAPRPHPLPGPGVVRARRPGHVPGGLSLRGDRSLPQ